MSKEQPKPRYRVRAIPYHRSDSYTETALLWAKTSYMVNYNGMHKTFLFSIKLS